MQTNQKKVDTVTLDLVHLPLYSHIQSNHIINILLYRCITELIRASETVQTSWSPRQCQSSCLHWEPFFLFAKHTGLYGKVCYKKTNKPKNKNKTKKSKKCMQYKKQKLCV